jgi:Ion channel
VRIVACILVVTAVFSVCLTRYFWLENNASSDPPNGYRNPADWAILALGTLFAATGLLSLSLRWSTAASLAIAISIDCYLAIVLVLAAVRADGSGQKQQPFVRKAIPHRLFALFFISLTFLALVVTFGNLYLNSRGICPVDAPDCYREAARIPSGGRASTNSQNIAVGTERRKGLVTTLDGAYFSMITMMTVGYGDFVAVNDQAKGLVIFQLGSSGFLLLCAFPLVVSRMATW